MNRCFIVADDFTGANDTGVQLTRRGFRTKVVLDPAGVLDDGLSYVLDTESRNIPNAEAREKVKKLLESLRLDAFDCVVKKVDSTLRGNIAEEIQETDRAYDSELVIFMPALPSLGRTTTGGVHRLNGVRIGLTELARDPRKPVLQDNIAQILKSVYDESVGLKTLQQIRAGELDFSTARLWACDAETNEDMLCVISAARKLGRRILWVGTAAMADNLINAEQPPLPSLAVIASVSEVAREQIHYAEQKGLKVQKVDIAALLRGADSAPIVEEAVRTLRAGEDLAFISSASYDRAELEASTAAGEEQGLSRDEVAEFTGRAISMLAAQILDAVKVAGLFLSGGDTAIHFIREVGATGAEITFELTVGIPLMRLAGGRFDGLKVITKAGAFGTPQVLPMIMRKLGEA